MAKRTRKPGQVIPKGPNKWLARAFLGRGADGKRRYHSRVLRGSKKDAQRYLNKVHREIDLGEFVEPSDQPLRDYLSEWVESTLAARVTDKSRSDYESLIRLYIEPALGDRRLSQLTSAEIQRVYNSLIERGLSARTVRYTHSVLHSALEQAVKWGLLSRNPAKLIDLPRQQTKEMQVLSVEEVGRFLRAARQDRWYALWELLVTTGLRPGEALALKWSDIDLADGRIHVQRCLVRPPRSGWSLKEPKTARGRRTVTLPPAVSRTLRKHRTEQLEERLHAGSQYEDRDFVFTTTNGSPLDWKVLVRRHFKRIVQTAGVPPIRPYDLRHTCATLLLAAGENVKVVSERLGHASAALTLDVYSHVLPDMQQRAADRLESILFSDVM